MNPQSDIHNYITAQLHAGLSSQEIAQQLRGAGWPDERITAVFAGYQDQFAPDAVVEPATDATNDTDQVASQSEPVSDQQNSEPMQLPPPIKRGRLKTGWLLFKQSLSVIKTNPGLSRYVVITMLWSIGIFGVLIAVFILDNNTTHLISESYQMHDGSTDTDVTPLGIIVGIIFAFFGTLVTYFYGAALSSHVLAIFRGQTTTYATHIARAKKRIVAITVYALIATTVGYLLRLLEQRFRIVGWIIARLLGALWTLATSFVLPIIADSEETGVQSIKHSVKLFKKTWGETIVSRVSLTGLIVIIYLGVVFPITVVTAVIMNGIFGFYGFIAIAGLYIIGCIVLAVLSSLASGILNVSLYYYAQYGKIPPSFNPELLASVFIPKKTKKKK